MNINTDRFFPFTLQSQADACDFLLQKGRKNMKQKEKSAETVKEIADVLRCTLCHRSMKVFALKSLVCSNNHTFDLAKQGYVNMMTRPSRSHYDKMLFESRQKIIMESNLYELLHKKIPEVIEEYLEGSHDPTVIIDAGCGEGSHLQRILERCNDNTITGIGLDISKEGIVMAAKHYHSPVWLVGDLANPPLTNQSCHCILNILSPANYQEFKRMMVPGGLMIKVVPRKNYLKELRKHCLAIQIKRRMKIMIQYHFLNKIFI